MDTKQLIPGVKPVEGIVHTAEGLVHNPLTGALETGAKTGVQAFPGNPAQVVKGLEGAVPSIPGFHIPNPLSGLAKSIQETVEAYGIRLGEILGGAALILFGLVTIANGGKPPNLPKALPVPIP